MMYGQKIQSMTLLAQIGQKMKRLIFLRDDALVNLRIHIKKHIATISPEQESAIQVLLNSIAIPPVANLDPAGMVPKMENIFKTYDHYLKNGLKRVVNAPNLEPISQSDLENLTNSLEVAIKLNIFYKVVEHFVKLAKKGGLMWVYTLSMQLPMLMDMAESLGAASGHFQSGLPIGDGFGPMVASKLSAGGVESCSDPETSVKDLTFEGRRLVVVKARGPGGSVGNPGQVTQDVIQTTQPALVISIDAGLRLESEKTGEVSEGVGVAMGGPGMDRFRIEESLAIFHIPILTVVCKMSMKEAISAMPKEVLDQVDPVIERVKRMILENTERSQSVVVIGVGNTMGVE